MGQKHAKHHSGDTSEAASNGNVVATSHDEENHTVPSTIPSSSATAGTLQGSPTDLVDSVPMLRLIGFPAGVPDTAQVLNIHTAQILRAALPSGTVPLHHEAWHLLYHSQIHGNSFQRLVQLICDRGPTLIVIRDATSRRVFGGYNETSWSTVAHREKDARSISAANARAKREGMLQHLVSRPANQAPTYFGSDKCFVFCVPSPDEPKSVHIYRARQTTNSNFMYLFDTHPDEERIGIGMGGQPPDQYGWFLDKWLEHGKCRGARCLTFMNPMLSTVEDWEVDAVEVYALGLQEVERLRNEEVLADGLTPQDDGTSIRKGSERKVDKIILELNRTHHFYGDDDPSAANDDDDC